MSSAMPWVNWRPWVPLANRPQNVPMIEFTAWPPSTGSPSTSTTLRPARAAVKRSRSAGDAGADDADIGCHPPGAASAWRLTILVSADGGAFIAGFRSLAE